MTTENPTFTQEELESLYEKVSLIEYLVIKLRADSVVTQDKVFSVVEKLTEKFKKNCSGAIEHMVTEASKAEELISKLQAFKSQLPADFSTMFQLSPEGMLWAATVACGGSPTYTASQLIIIAGLLVLQNENVDGPLHIKDHVERAVISGNMLTICTAKCVAEALAESKA